MNHAPDLLDALLGQPEERQRLITLYLRDGMEDDLLAAFELRLMDDPALLDEVELEQAMVDSLRALPPETVPAVPAMPVATGIEPMPPPSHGRRWRPPPLWAAAAGLMVGILSHALWVGVRGDALGGGAMPGIEPADVFTLDTRRGAGSEPLRTTLELSRGSRRVVLQIASSGDPGPYRVRVIDSGRKVEYLRSDDLQPDTFGLLQVAIRADALPEGTCVVVLESMDGSAWQERRADVLEFKRRG